ncbi:MAG: V-type ATP synthase subunit A, partial [Rikenellaceae bacterium]
MKTTGRVVGITSNLVTVKVDGAVSQNEICYISLGDVKLMSEVIKVDGSLASVQVFESTRGLKAGSLVEFEGHMLEVTLGPGIMSRIYDGLQNDLQRFDALFLERGVYNSPIDFESSWDFTPIASSGDVVTAGDWLGSVKENFIDHKIMVPFKMNGKYTVKSVVAAGNYKITDTVAVIVDSQGTEHSLNMIQKWPVKDAVLAYKEKPRPIKTMDTGMRAIDTFNPIAEGGTGFVPGPFGAGKTVLQHTISKQAAADVILFVACGERANEVV